MPFLQKIVSDTNELTASPLKKDRGQPFVLDRARKVEREIDLVLISVGFLAGHEFMHLVSKSV